jgi:hypothetical protein
MAGPPQSRADFEAAIAAGQLSYMMTEPEESSPCLAPRKRPMSSKLDPLTGFENVSFKAAAGASPRAYLSRRWSFAPEFIFMQGPGDDRDILLVPSLAFDFSSSQRIRPYLVFGAGVLFHHTRWRPTRVASGPSSLLTDLPQSAGNVFSGITANHFWLTRYFFCSISDYMLSTFPGGVPQLSRFEPDIMEAFWTLSRPADFDGITKGLAMARSPPMLVQISPCRATCAQLTADLLHRRLRKEDLLMNPLRSVLSVLILLLVVFGCNSAVHGHWCYSICVDHQEFFYCGCNYINLFVTCSVCESQEGSHCLFCTAQTYQASCGCYGFYTYTKATLHECGGYQCCPQGQVKNVPIERNDILADCVVGGFDVTRAEEAGL